MSERSESLFLPEMPISKCMIGAGFQIFFEGIGLLIVGKPYSDDNSPRKQMAFCIACQRASDAEWRRGDSSLRPRTQIYRANFHRGAAPLVSLACARSYHPNDLGKSFSQTLLGFKSPHQGSKPNGGGGIRTPVPRCFKTSVYMLSRFIVFSPH